LVMLILAIIRIMVAAIAFAAWMIFCEHRGYGLKLIGALVIFGINDLARDYIKRKSNETENSSANESVL
jgi:hypothetical protein